MNEMNEVKQIPELLTVPQNEIGSVEYINPDSKEVIEKFKKTNKSSMDKTNSNVKKLNNNYVINNDEENIYYQEKKGNENKGIVDDKTETETESESAVLENDSINEKNDIIVSDDNNNDIHDTREIKYNESENSSLKSDSNQGINYKFNKEKII